MIIHGVQPGPMLMVNNPQFVYDVVAMTLLATLGMLVFGLFLVKPLLAIVRIPRSIIMPVIFVLCTVGSYAIASRMFDVYLMLTVGVLAFLLRRRGYPIPPFVLGLVLGDILDKNLRRGLTLTDGDIAPFFTRPISALLAAVTIFTMLMYVPSFNRGVRELWSRARSAIGMKRSA
jgi:putative tricarboxylic transport membrane protein